MIHERDIGIGLGKVGGHYRERGDQDLEMGIWKHSANWLVG